MERSALTNPSTSTLIDLAIQLRRDEALPMDRLRERDRAVGRRLGLDTRGGGSPGDGFAGGAGDGFGKASGGGSGGGSGGAVAVRAGWVTAWLGALDQPVHRGAEALAFVGVATALVGGVLGYAAAMALFYYDGDSLVNVVGVLAVFVVGQAITLGLWGVAALPGRVPGGAVLRGLSPGRWTGWVARWLPGETREALGSITGRAGGHQRVYGRVQKWQVLSWSQAMGVAFNAAALAGALQLIVFSDLGFGWSTTLDVDAGTMHAVTGALSWPWEWAARWWPGVVPARGLVEGTQIYRAQELIEEVDPAEAARWWPFLVMCMAVYGVLPRLLLWGLARWRLKRAVAQAVSWTPGVDAVLERLGSRVVETRADGREPAAGGGAETVGAVRLAGGASAVVRWAEVPVEDASGSGAVVLDAGGGRSLAEDEAAVAAASSAARGGGESGGGDGEQEALPAGGAVVVMVKAWEPPVLEFLDFLRDLRSAMGPGRTIGVRLMGEGDRAMWRERLGSVGDPWLKVVDEQQGGRA